MFKLHSRMGIFFLVLLLCLQTLGLSGCEKAEQKNAAQQKGEPEQVWRPFIGVLLYRASDAYISMVANVLEEELGTRAYLVILDADDSQITQTEQLNLLIANGLDALIVNLVDTQAASSVVDEAKKADIPLLFFNREPDLNVVKLYAKACFVGTTTREAGVLQGRVIAELWKNNPHFDRNRDGKCQYIMFQGNADNPEAISRTEYSVKEARENGVDMQQVGQTNICNWDKGLAYEAMKMALAMHSGQIEMVVANNDMMALGAIEAMAEAGFNRPGGPKDKFIPVFGVDAVPPALEAIKNGVMSATVKQDYKAMGLAITEIILNMANGRAFLEGTGHSWDESGVAVRIPYSMVGAD